MSRQKRMAFPTSLKLWKTSVFSSAYSMISLSWWWKNSRIPGQKYSHHLAKSTFFVKKKHLQNLLPDHLFIPRVKRSAKQYCKRPLKPHYINDNLWLPGEIRTVSAGLPSATAWPTFGPSIRPSQHTTGGSLNADSKITGGKPGTELRVQNSSNLQITKPSNRYTQLQPKYTEAGSKYCG